jgi:predicted RND superfamily exporter protein
VVLSAIPLALEYWPSSRERNSPSGDDSARPVDSTRRIDGIIIEWILRWRVAVLIGGIGFVSIIGYGLAHTTSSVKVERMFRPDNELIRNYKWIEENIGPIASLEVVVCFDESSELRMVDRLRLIQRIEGRLRKLPNLDATNSAGTMLPWVGSTRSIKAVMRRSAMNQELIQSRDRLIADRLVADAGSEEWWRITARLPAMQDLDYPAIIAADEQAKNTSRVECTGAFPSINSAQKQLLSDLVYSFLLAFVLICPVMMIILRSWLAGLVAMVGNVVPAVLVFGAMGWLAIPVEIGTVLTGSIALGIAVDDTLHFLTWHQRCLGIGGDRIDAIREAFSRCATAMTQTTLICGLSLLVFMMSPFIPAARFSVLMFTLLLAALAGDLILLPAILASPLGRLFRIDNSSSSANSG